MRSIYPDFNEETTFPYSEASERFEALLDTAGASLFYEIAFTNRYGTFATAAEILRASSILKDARTNPNIYASVAITERSWTMEYYCNYIFQKFATHMDNDVLLVGAYVERTAFVKTSLFRAEPVILERAISLRFDNGLIGKSTSIDNDQLERREGIFFMDTDGNPLILDNNQKRERLKRAGLI
jgi:hypothetical protein